jgi:hypothetical protein
MKALIAIIATLISITTIYSSCENGESARITRDAIKDIKRGMKLEDSVTKRMALSNDCRASWIRGLFPEVSREIRRTLNPKNHCGIEITFNSEKEMKNFFADYLDFNLFRDHFVAYDLFSDSDVAVCGIVN